LNRPKIAIATLGCLLILSSCSTTFRALNAENPPVGDPRFPKTAESIQPTFKWSPAPEPDVTYDLIVYECVETFGNWGGIFRVPGKEVYLRKAVENTEHRIEEPLMPGKKYYWSVRIRKGDTVGPWSRYDYFLFLGIGFVQRDNELFLFQTPEP
jgi:hypothetical protein